jgi:hypothetical protein
MSVNPVTLHQKKPVDSLGCVGSTVRWIALAIMRLVQPLFNWLGWNWNVPSSEVTPQIDVSFEVALLDGVRKGFVAPARLINHFEKHVDSDSQDRIYENLGRERPLSYLDRTLNTLWRDAQAVLARYREIGRVEAKMDPYRVAVYLETELQRKIDQSASGSSA